MPLLWSDTQLIPRKILCGDPEKADPSISPDGRLLAYLATDEGVLNVWVRTIGRDDDRPVTQDRKRGIHNYFWQPDNAHILYLQDADGNENFHVYQTAIDTRETKDLTPFDEVRADIVAVDPAHPDLMLVTLNRRDPSLFDVYRLYFGSGELALDTENPGDVAGWSADNEFQVRASIGMLPDGSQEIRVRNDPQSEWKSFQVWGPDENPGGVLGFAPGDRALWLSSSVGANTSRLLEVDIATNTATVVAEDPHYDIGGGMRNPRTRKLEAVAFVRARVEWQFLDASVQADFDVLAHVRRGEMEVISRDYDDRRWVISYSADDSPVVYYLYDRAAKKAEFLFAARPALEPYPLAPMEPIEFPARDGLALHGYLTMPLGLAWNAPTVLLVHGGPWERDVWGYSRLVQLLANRGYAVLQVNFRGSVGYGKNFLNAGDREWGARMHDDLLDAKLWAVERGFADPARIAIMGGSYGGYATLVGLAFTPDEFACGVDIVGPSNLITLLESIPAYWAPMRALFDKRVGRLEDEQDFLKSRSPLFQADRIQAPLLILQGANDPRVKQAESDQIVKAMHDHGKPVEYLVFPDEGHGFVRQENDLKFYAATEDFLARYLGGRAEPPAPDEDWHDVLQAAP
jgi:dipeptidyl aminopeptidase/acylaminoacyl peptidase